MMGMICGRETARGVADGETVEDEEECDGDEQRNNEAWDKEWSWLDLHSA